MERYLTDLNVWVWRYLENERNFPGLHFTADSAACESLGSLVKVLRAEGGGTRRTLNLRKLAPADEAKVSGGQKYQDFSVLRLKLSLASEALQHMSASYEGGTVSLDFTPAYLDLFDEGIADVARGTGDYAIGPPGSKWKRKRMPQRDRESLVLWFWPCFGHVRPVPR